MGINITTTLLLVFGQDPALHCQSWTGPLQSRSSSELLTPQGHLRIIKEP